MQDHEKLQTPLAENGIAIVGMSCRFPGALTIEHYWQNLLSGVESIKREANIDGRVYARAELPDIENFDYRFFGFSLKEAQLLDPQHRVLLECAWEVLENASIDTNSTLIGVFCGAGPSSYFINHVLSQRAPDNAVGLYHSSETLTQFMSTDKEFLASRIAYKLNCCGPAVNIQAACATSLFAIQAAIQSLQLGECDTALAGAAAISVPQSIPYYFEAGMPFSADGYCRPFDIKASGTVFGSGAAVVALKRLSDAIADGDQIHAVIRSVATNNDGAQRAGMSAPSVAGQARVIGEAFEIAGICPEQMHYIEAHGTATPIGDPIEIKALANAFRARDRKQTCYLGSVKGNIGHLGWAAGMAGLIKAALIVRHKVIPPTINFEEYNPQLYIEETPFMVNQQQVELNVPHVMVGVSSFGLGGNNSHLIIETPPLRQSIIPEPEKLWLIPISAKERKGVKQLCDSYRQFLEKQPDEHFSTFVANLQRSRTLFEHRTFVIASHRQEAIDALANISLDPLPTAGQPPHIGLMFSGQGNEHQDMGRALYVNETRFKTELDSFNPVCLEIFGTTAANLLFDKTFNRTIKQDIALSQPLTFAIQMSMARLFLSHGNMPVAFFGHSLGEYAAACLAGVFSPEQGFKILVERSRLLASLGDIGTMVAVSGDHACALKLIKLVGHKLSIAALNSSNNTVISGTQAAIEELVRLAASTGVTTKPLNISRPGHSWLLDPLLAPFEAFLHNMDLHPPTAAFISTVSGKLIGAEAGTPHYWCQQLRETVNFRASVTTALELGCTHLIEIGHKATLSALVLSDMESSVSVLPLVRGNQRDHLQYLTVMGELFCAGAHVNVESTGRRLPVLDGLPAYPFQRSRCWIESSTPAHSLNEFTHRVVWQPLPLAALNNSASPPQKVLFLTWGEHLNLTEIEALKSAFKQFQWIAMNPLMGIDKSPHASLEGMTPQDLRSIWKGDEEGLDRIYFDLRELPTDEVSIAINACTVVLHLLQSLLATYQHRPQICLLFATPQGENENMSLNPVANSVVGMLRSVAIEDPELKISAIHFLPEQPQMKTDDSAAIELLPLAGELEITVKQNEAYVTRLENIEFDNHVEDTFPTDHSYILLGGAGGIGRQLIESLCTDHACSIYVFGRSTTPNDAFLRLMTRFPTIHYLNIDLTTSQGREAGATWLQSASLGKVTVFNLAVDLNDRLSVNLQRQDFSRAFESKCSCILNLYQLLCEQGATVDVIFNFSSASSILGNGGQSSYSAASAFLDAAHERLFPHAAKVFTINWGVWADAGKLQDDQHRIQVLKTSGLDSHSSKQGIRFIRHLLAGASRCIAFMKIDVARLSARSTFCAYLLERMTAKNTYHHQVKPQDISARLLACSSKAEVSFMLETWLISTVDALVGIGESTQKNYEAIKDLGFKALGFDSLALVQLKNELIKSFGMQCTVKRISTLQALSELHSELVSHVLQSTWHATDHPPHGVEKTTIEGIPLSVQQVRWLSLIEKGYGLRIIPYLIYSPFNAEYCRTALLQILDEQPLLRTFFPNGRATVRTSQQILDRFGTLHSDLSSLTAAQKAQQISTLVQTMAQALPKPQDNVSWGIHFVNVGEPFFIALLGVQHLEFDGKSLTLLFERLGECLYRLSEHLPLLPIEQAVNYMDYAQCQQQYLSQWSKDVYFFKGLFHTFEAPTVLPGHPGFASTTVHSSSRYSVEIPGVNRRLEELAENNGFSVFNAILYVYATTMAEVLGCDQLMISTINSGRGRSEFNNVIGPFTSPFPIPITVHRDWLRGIENVARTLEAIQSYPLMHPAMMINEVPAFTHMAQDSYFSDLGINFLNYRHTTHASCKLKIEAVEILSPVSSELLAGANVEDMRRVPGLHLVVEINGDDLRFNFWFHTHRFSLAQVREWGQILEFNLEQLLRQRDDKDA